MSNQLFSQDQPSLSRLMIKLQNDAVQNALDATEPRSFEPSLSLSLDMMLDCDLSFWSYTDEQGETCEVMARYIQEVIN